MSQVISVHLQDLSKGIYICNMVALMSRELVGTVFIDTRLDSA
jgi:hypothetical protein